MKKISCFVCIISITICVVIFSSCSMFYSYGKIDNFEFGYSERLNRAFIGKMDYKIGDNTTITLPEYYNGIPIKELGGYTGTGYPQPFYVNITDLDDIRYVENTEILYSNKQELAERIENGEVFDYCDITLQVILPKNLDSVENSDADSIRILESVYGETLTHSIVYRVFFEFSIDQDNKYFYTENGRLFYKKSSQLVKGFLYK